MVMDNRFCRPHWSQSALHPRFHINDGGLSGHSAQPFAQNHEPLARANSKVVQIPVRFVDSEPSKPNSALKIQKAFRGFLIRSRVKKILQLKREAIEIEERISRSDVVELIQTNERERLRNSEMLMALLFKLDSIRGVDAGVRDCRKAVIKKVISLQERLDSITDKVQSKSLATDKDESSEEFIDSVLSNSAVESQDSECNIAIKEPDPEICSAEGKCLNNGAAVTCEEDGAKCKSETSRDEYEDAIDSREKAKSKEDTDLEKETGEISNMAPVVGECMKETNQTMAMDSTKNMAESGVEKKENVMNNNNNQQVLMQRLMEDNQTMMNMMTNFFERNEMQTQMLNSLRNKVEQLEKAFVCDRMRRKKKRHNP